MAPEIATGTHGEVKGFAHGTGTKQAVEEMDEAIEVIAVVLAEAGHGLAGELGPPFPVGNLRVGVMGAQGVEAEKAKEEQVGGLREDEPSRRDPQERESRGNGYVLHPPVLEL